MVDPDIVAYIQTHMGRVPIEDLRRYLTKEGISDLDFDEALRAAKEKTAPPIARKPAPRPSNPLLAIALAAAALGAGFLAYQRVGGRKVPAGLLDLAPKKSKMLEESLGHEAASLSLDPDKLSDPGYRINYLSKLDAVRKLRADLAAAYNSEGTPEPAIEILKNLILESAKPEMVGMTDFSQTGPALIIRASYYKELARSFEIQKDAEHQKKALAKAEALEKSAEVLNSKEKKEEQTQKVSIEASKKKELEDILK